MLGLKPIQLLPARERVASALRKAILTRQISEGEVLTLDNTAKELGISITPEEFQRRLSELQRAGSRSNDRLPALSLHRCGFCIG